MNYKKYTLLFLAFSLFGIDQVKAQDSINISPVVQVISYYDIYGKYPMMMWWGSASVISRDWVIISNDHVVDAGNWALASAFSVCITKEIGQKPKCDYTASLINRDDKLDVSMLRIDPVDIYGNKVDYSQFKTIDIDFDYAAKVQDETIAIGYPWVGADTISETKWIVSWVSEYNSYKYIKTDTLIAWGNSGWAFVHDGKLIGIPTFGMGWNGDNTMWYALSISEAKSFIEENLSKESTKNPITNLIDFNSYRKSIEDLNSQNKIKDNFFDISISSDYEVQNYIKDNAIQIVLKRQKDTGVTNLWVKLEKVPNLDTDKKIYYYLEKTGFYNKDYSKLIKKDINGISFYMTVDKTDLSNWEASWGKSYKAIIGGWKYMISLDVQAPFYDEKKNKDVKKEVDLVLSGLKFDTSKLDKIDFSFDINIPKISIKSFPKAIADTGNYSLYFDKNLYELMNVWVWELYEYNWKGETMDKIYDVELKDIDVSKKAKIKFKWLDWYIYCSDNGYYNYYYSANSNYYSSYFDENGNSVDLKTCNIKILFPKNDDLNRHNFINIDIVAKKNNLSADIDKTIDFITKYMDVWTNDNTVSIPNILKNQIDLKFKDLWNQSDSYKNMLKVLVRYGIIKNSDKFDWERWLKWWEYLNLYVKAIYNFKLDATCKSSDYTCMFKSYKLEINWEQVSLDKVFKDLGIDYNEYIMSNNMYNFPKYLEYKLAWVSIWEFTDENIARFENMIDTPKFQVEKDKIDNFRTSIYGKKAINIRDFYTDYSSYLFSTKEVKYYIGANKLVYSPIYENKLVSFSYKWDYSTMYSIEYANIVNKYSCDKNKNFWNYIACSKKAKQEIENLSKKYPKYYVEVDKNLNNKTYYLVYTKAQAITDMLSSIDFWLFDKDLAKRKDTVVE